MQQANISKISESQAKPFPRVRVILEFIEGNLDRPPIVYPPCAGTDEDADALRREILKRWTPQA
jgi:GTPase Era involved in 16S rRNA processing